MDPQTNNGDGASAVIESTPENRINFDVTETTTASETTPTVATPAEKPKTKTAVALLQGLNLAGKILVVTTREDNTAISSFRNLPTVKTIDAGELNTYDVLDSDWVVFTDETLLTAKEAN